MLKGFSKHMAALDWLIRIAQGLRPIQVGAILALLMILLAFEDRRVSGLALFLQYGLLGLLTLPYVYTAVALARGVLAVGISMMLYLSAWRVQRQVRRRERNAPSPLGRQGLGALFNLSALALGGLLAYGVWSAYPLALVPRPLALAGYWVAALGLVTALIGEGPLRRGIGLMLIVSGCESLYLAVERGLLVIGLVGILDVMLALALVYTTEMWIEAQQGVSTP